MSRTASARSATRRTFRSTAVGLVVLTAAIVGTLVYQSASASAPSFREVLGGASSGDDGALPDGVTVADDEHAGVANLDPSLLQALRDAAAAAADDGIELSITSGWRSPERQDQLLREAIAEYSSEEEAARWVATADTSAHVSGDAVDIGPSEATPWMAEHGAAYGLCQIYGNEPWHLELRPEAIAGGCPATYADPTQNPRMQQ